MKKLQENKKISSSNSRKKCPICLKKCTDGIIINLSNGRSCHEACATNIWKQVLDKRLIAETQRSQAYPGQKQLDDVTKQIKELERTIYTKKRDIGFFNSIFSTTYKNEINILSRQIDIATQEYSKMMSERQYLSDALFKSYQRILAESDEIYEKVKTYFDYWSDYPPDWEWRRHNKLSKLRSKAYCPICYSDSSPLHVHHKKPLSKGGNNKAANLLVMCEDCHLKEHNVKSFFGDNSTSNARSYSAIVRQTIKDAIKSSGTIKFQYTKYNGEEGVREIDPSEILIAKGSQCVRGFCHLRQEARTFAIKRITDIKIL